MLVEKTVHRLGREHVQKYWVRSEEPGDEPGRPPPQQRIAKPRPLGMSDKDWQAELERRRVKNEYVRQWRAKRAQQGLLKKPDDPPPPLPPPIKPGPPEKKEGDEKVDKRREYVKRWREKQKLLKQQVKEQGKPPPPEKPPELPRKPGELKDWTRNLIPASKREWLAKNAGVLRELGNDLVEQFKTTPPDVQPYGVTGVESVRMSRGLLGQYGKGIWKRGTVMLRPDVAKNLVAQVRAGGQATPEGAEAIRVLTHECFHAASHPDYEYEGRHLKQRPHAAIQEATTETLAQMHKAKVMTALGVQPRPEDSHPLFMPIGERERGYMERAAATGEVLTPAVLVARASSYPTYVRQFGRVVATIEGHENLDQNVERWARDIKGTRGGMRYERLADALVGKRLPRDHDSFPRARMEVVKHLHNVLQEDQSAEQIQSGVRAIVDDVVSKGRV